jgi:predicted kinase
MVIIVYGLPGSGKSYFASRLAMQLEAEYVNSDEIRVKLLSERTYTEGEKLKVYEEMVRAMAAALAAHNPIVLDATFYKRSIRRKFEHKASMFKEKIIYIEVTAPEDIIEDRLKVPRIYSEADFDVYLKLKGVAEPLREKHLVLESSNNNIGSMLHEAIRYIQTIT